MAEVVCDKHGRGDGTRVCPHISFEALLSSDLATRVVGVRAESGGKTYSHIAVCMNCLEATFDGIERHNPENIDGSVLLREVATNTLCTKCLAEYGIGAPDQG